ncbi:hypothetical protein Tco_0626142 [Tanacetum coccineum]|uniref:Uncharacterized protein n=1 Tax=Tanacetum coccineum TaxID=301880 RepID=A0ABQ4WIR6_9ASTR
MSCCCCFGLLVAIPFFDASSCHDDFEPKQNVEKVKEHLIAEEIEKIVEGSENVDELVSFNLNSQNDPDTRSDPRSYKESLKVEKTVDVQPLALKIKFEGLQASNTLCRYSTIRPRDQDDPHDDAHPEGRIVKPGPSTSGNQEQLDDFDFWMNTYATDDDELPVEKVSQELVEEMSQTVDEAKLRKVVNEMLR